MPLQGGVTRQRQLTGIDQRNPTIDGPDVLEDHGRACRSTGNTALTNGRGSRVNALRKTRVRAPGPFAVRIHGDVVFACRLEAILFRFGLTQHGDHADQEPRKRIGVRSVQLMMIAGNAAV